MSETNQVLLMIASMVAGGASVLFWSQPQMLRRATCWLRGGHSWRYFDEDQNVRQCARCCTWEYAGIEDVDGNKTWFDR